MLLPCQLESASRLNSLTYILYTPLLAEDLSSYLGNAFIEGIERKEFGLTVVPTWGFTDGLSLPCNSSLLSISFLSSSGFNMGAWAPPSEY